MAKDQLCLVCRVFTKLCAVPLEHVSEMMRCLPISTMIGMPQPVIGVAIIRGLPVPVVDVARLLAEPQSHPTRFITLKVGARLVALAVDDVVGVRRIPGAAVADLPPLLSDASLDAVEAIGTLDSQLLVVLRSARLVPEPAWGVIEGSTSPR